MAALIEITANVAQILVDLTLNPIITASTLAFIGYGPSHFVTRAVDSVLANNCVGLQGLKTALRVLLVLGLGRGLNRLQNMRASNNWRFFGHEGWHWNEEIAVITGGCNGIGKAIALGLLRKGVRVAILDIAELPSDLVGLDTVFYWKCDISSPDAMSEAAEEIRKSLGHPSILINNAGLAGRSSILDSDPKQLSRLFGVNVLSHWYTVKAFLPTMIRENKGHIITIASMASFVALSTAVDYSSSKSAVLSFHEGLACEIKNLYKAPGVMTTVVHPRFVNTGMTHLEKDIIERSRGEVLEPEDISDVILNQLFSCRGAQLIIPSQRSWVSGVRGFPNWLQETIRDAFAGAK